MKKIGILYTYPGWETLFFYVETCKKQKYVIALMRTVDITNIDIKVCKQKNELPSRSLKLQEKYHWNLLTLSIIK